MGSWPSKTSRPPNLRFYSKDYKIHCLKLIYSHIYLCTPSFINHFIFARSCGKHVNEIQLLPQRTPIIAGLVDLNEKGTLRYVLQEGTECCDSILDGELISPREREMREIEIGKVFTEDESPWVSPWKWEGRWERTSRTEKKKMWRKTRKLENALWSLPRGLSLKLLKLVDGSQWLPLKVTWVSTQLSPTWSLRTFQFYILTFLSVCLLSILKVKLSRQQIFKHIQFLVPFFRIHQGYQT